MNIFQKVKQYWTIAYSRFRSLSHGQLMVLGLVMGITIGALFTFFNINSGSAIGETENPKREVGVASVGELSSMRASLPLVGIVTSISEATIRSESSGEIVGVYRRLGDQVGVGTIIAEIENSRERAALQSAEAALSISKISGGREKSLLEEARASAINTLKSSHDIVDDSIRTKIDPMFIDANLSSPKFIVSTSGSQLSIDINFGRLRVGEIIAEQNVRIDKLGAESDLKKEIEKLDSEMRYIKDFVDDVIAGLNQGIPSAGVPQTTIDTWKATAAAVRTSLNSSLASLSSAKDNLTTKEAGADTSGGGTSGAAITQAEAQARLARINLEKTLIRSPIVGTINNFSLERGDFVTAFEEVAVVSNNKTLEIRSYITEEDAREISVGAEVIIEGNVKGAVTKVAPALDPKTKKIEVKISLGAQNIPGSELVNGESVRLNIARTARATNQESVITIPIGAVKITADGPVVFTVENDVLKSHKIVEGSLLGDTIVINEGLTADMNIVVDARGLKEGDAVTVKE